MIRLAALGAALIGLTLAGLALHEPEAITLPSLRATEMFVGLAALAGVVYLLAVRTVLARPADGGGRAVWLVLAVALALRLPLLFEPPFLSSDMFRYVWDGKVQAAGINPYRYVPADPSLAALRDPAIFPHVNRAFYAHTIYPPAAELIYALAARLSPTVLGMKAMMLVFELIGVLAVLRLLDRAALPLPLVLIYAWNPLAVWSFAGNGHVDALAIGLIGPALLAAAGRRSALAGALLGAAILTKFLPAAIAAALWRPREGRGWDWRFPAACAAVILALYSVYLDAGWNVLGFLPGYAAEEGISRGDGFWLLAAVGELAPLGASAARIYEIAAALALAALASRVVLGRRPAADPRADTVALCRNAALLGAAAMVALSPHYAWYYAWLALPCCVAPLRGVIYLSVAALLLDLNPWDERFVWPSLVFVPAILLALRDLRHPLHCLPTRRGPP